MRSAWLFLLVGCSPAFREAKQYERQGDYYRASQVWISALEVDLDDSSARRQLHHTAPQAYKNLIDIAEEQEAARKYTDSIQTLHTALAFQTQLDELAALDFPTQDLVIMRTEVEDSLAATHYEAGAQHQQAGEYSLAVAEWLAAREVRPEYRDTTERLAEAYLAWARKDIADRHYSSATDHFDASLALLNRQPVRTETAILHYALGIWYQGRGECRAASAAFHKARDLDPSFTIEQETAAADHCARVQLVLEPFENPEGTVLAGRSLGTQLSDLVEVGVQKQASVHVTWIDPTLAPPLGKSDGSRFRIRAALHRTELQRPPEVTEARTIAGAMLFTCPSEGSDAFDVVHGFVCEAPAEANCTHHRLEASARVEGTLRIFDGEGRQVGTFPLSSTPHSQAEWLTDCTRAGSPIRLGDTPAVDTLAVAKDVLSLLKPPSALPDDESLWSEALSSWADSASSAVLSVVDAPAAASNPPELDLRHPNDPSTIEFRGANPEEVVPESTPK